MWNYILGPETCSVQSSMGSHLNDGWAGLSFEEDKWCHQDFSRGQRIIRVFQFSWASESTHFAEWGFQWLHSEEYQALGSQSEAHWCANITGPGWPKARLFIKCEQKGSRCVLIMSLISGQQWPRILLAEEEACSMWGQITPDLCVSICFACLFVCLFV